MHAEPTLHQLSFHVETQSVIQTQYFLSSVCALSLFINTDNKTHQARLNSAAQAPSLHCSAAAQWLLCACFRAEGDPIFWSRINVCEEAAEI